MNPSKSWTVLAFVPPGLVALLWSLTSPRVRFAACHAGVARLAYRNLSVIVLTGVVMIAASALVFIVHALQNAHLSWGMRLWWATALLLFSPIIVPAYWMIHLRRR